MVHRSHRQLQAAGGNFAVVQDPAEGDQILGREYIVYIYGLYSNNGKENGNYYVVYRGYIEIIANRMETTI